MAGVRANLEAVHRARVSSPQPGQQGQDATVAEIIDLYAREQILGFQLTEGQQKLLGGWREWLEGNVARELGSLKGSFSDSSASKNRQTLLFQGRFTPSMSTCHYSVLPTCDILPQARLPWLRLRYSGEG